MPESTSSSTSTATLPSNNLPPKPKKKNHFLRNFTLFLILILILALCALSYLLLRPNEPVSRFVINNTALRDVIKTDNSASSSSASNANSSQANDGNVISNFFSRGADNNNSNSNNAQGNQTFEFSPETGNRSATEIVDQALPAVLSLSVSSKADRRSNLITETAGTGYIVSEDGLVISNKHVIAQKCKDGSNAVEITGLSHDQKAYQLQLLSVDPVDDIAILKIQNATGTFKKVNFADSSKLKLGSDVLAIGNVLGQLQNTVTKGIISGLDRSLQTELVDECTGQPISPDGLIQTDAAINKGNSGGPLFDASGNLVGMNTFGTTEAQNVGLAISSNTILAVLNSFQRNGKIVRPRLGVITQPLNPLEKANNDWLPVDYGEIIYNEKGESVGRDSAALTAGLAEGDIILEVDGQKIVSNGENVSPLRRAILSKQVDSEIELTILKTVPSPEGSGFRYETTPKKIKVKLGGVSFDLPKPSIFQR